MPHSHQILHQKTVKNRILAALPELEFAMIAKSLVRVDLQLGETLHRAGEKIEYIFFPEIGFISALTVLSDGSPLEIGLIGAEGVAGVSVILGATTSYSEAMCQTGGGAHRISVSAFTEAVAHAPHLRDLLLRYAHVFHLQVAQTAACNAHHELGQRLARWLLGAHDRSGVAELSLTQDLIAVMLGVRRSTVSVAAAMLQKAGVIRYQHGRITIIDRVGLENAACECYEAVAGEYRRLFGEHPKDVPPGAPGELDGRVVSIIPHQI
jgi:CRP-like cAMP-binding protein